MASIGGGKHPDFPDELHARLLNGFDGLVRELGGDPVRISNETRLDPVAASRSYRSTTALVEAAARALGCPDFGLRLARRQGGGIIGPLSRVMRHSRTLADAIAYVAAHSQAHGDAARVRIERDAGAGAIFVGHDILLPGPPFWSQSIEQILLLGHLGAIEMTAAAARARRVDFRHQPLSSARVYRDAFGCEVRFGQAEDGIVFLDADFRQPVVDTDAEAYRAAVAEVTAHFPARDPPIRVAARAHLIRTLGTGSCDNDAVARSLGLHSRTLHRRLRAEGTSFQRLKNDVRRDVLLYYLCRTHLDLSTVSERLGFAEQAVMTRFCRKLLGACPTQVRERSAAR